jgi:hypothetical protein
VCVCVCIYTYIYIYIYTPYDTVHVSSVVAYWTRMAESIGSSSDQMKFLLFLATPMLLYILQIIILPKFCIFRKSIIIHHFTALLYVALMSVQTNFIIAPRVFKLVCGIALSSLLLCT